MKTSRRQFIHTAVLAGTASDSLLPALLTGSPRNRITVPLPRVRLGFIGVGLRGRQHIQQVLRHDDVDIRAICDPDLKSIGQAGALIREAGRRAPDAYTRGDEAFLQMLGRDDLDGVIIATPPAWHTPMAVATMKAGACAGVDVSATVTLQESWDLVNTAEQTGMPCMLLENVCYRRDVLAVLNMVQQGLFGHLTYAHCGYRHQAGYSTGSDRWPHSTHGLGPVAHWLNINRGNRFVSLTSTITKSRGLTACVVAPGADVGSSYRLSDVVTTVITCASGQNIVLIHDSHAPRPYSTGFRAQGTGGVWMGDNNLISLTNPLAAADQQPNWKPFSTLQAAYDHPLWTHEPTGETGTPAGYGAHGDIDRLMIRAFIDSVKTRTRPPIDVYDAAAWSAIRPLSELSLAGGGKPVDIPDFTRGKWETNPPVFGLNLVFDLA